MGTHERATLKRLLEAGTLAVSADNGQPWSFRWHDSRLFLHLDAHRAASFFDRMQFAALFGLGTVIENLSIAAAHAGYAADCQLEPRDRTVASPCLARIRFAGGPPHPHPLYPAIARRATNRKPFDPRPVPWMVQAALNEPFTELPSLRLVLLERPEEIHALSAFTGAADRIRFDFSSQVIHEDFFGRVRFTRREARRTGDGLWISCLEVKPQDRLALRLLAIWPIARLASHLGAARLFAQQSAKLLQRTPLVALLVGRSEQLHDQLFIHAGRLGQRCWLIATQHGVACQPMAVLPLFFAQHEIYGAAGFQRQEGRTVARMHAGFQERFGLNPDDHLLMVFRLGYAPPPSARAFRRSVEDLLTIEDDSPLVSSTA